MFGTYGSFWWWFDGLETAPVFSTLPGITRFQSGVGRAGDLLVRVREDLEGGWFPVIHTGFYYVGTEEHYLYSKKGTTSFTVTTTGTIQTVVVTDLIKDPTKIGPIIVRNASAETQLQRVCSALRAYRPAAFTTTGDPRTASSSGLLVSLVSHPTTGILMSVPATGDIISNDDYVYKPRTGTLYIRDTSPPYLYATYLVNEYDRDLLKQEQIIVVDTDRKARVQHRDVSMVAGLVPQLRKPTPLGTVTASGIAVTGNIIQYSPSGGISSGDVIAVEYYVNNSFTAFCTGSSLVVQFLPAATGSYVIEYETGGEWYDTSLLPSGSADYVQLNPLINQRESGFLYIVDAFQSPPEAKRIRLTLSNPTPVYNPQGSPYVMIATTVFDAEHEPIPGVNITTTVSGAPGALQIAGQSSLATNGLGQVLHTFIPAATGVVQVTSTVQSNGLSGSILFIVRGIDQYETLAEQRLGKLILHMEETPYLGNLVRLNAYHCYADGSPFQQDGNTDVSTTTVVFSSNRSQFFNLDGFPLPDPSVGTDQDGIASVLVEAVPGDVIRAYVETPTAGRVRYARPIRIPEIEQEIQ